MKKILITGAEGFVASYLSEELKNDFEIEGGYFIKKNLPIKSFFLDVTEFSQVEEKIREGSYDAIFHLAGQSSAKIAKVNSYDTYRINIFGALNLAEAIIRHSIKTRLLFISTSDVYGNPKYLPVDENHPVSPLNAYSHSKLLAEDVLLGYSRKNLDLVIARSFNHTGVGQTVNFFIPSMIEQVKNSADGGTIHAGDLSLSRDFSDVRDVVNAYRKLLSVEKGIYNISSESSIKLSEIVNYIIKKSSKKINVKQRPDLIREGEPAEFYGTAAKLKSRIEWKRERTIFDTIDWMMSDE
ncbi:MAG: NAD-dependent epimerase/dehydratase family protein [bacterium]